MRNLSPDSATLAPLQRLMLARRGGEAHVEQVEVSFSPHISPARIQQAWCETVAQTEALQITFPDDCSWKWATKLTSLEIQRSLPESWAAWLAHDRQEEVLVPNASPWRAVFWPAARRLVWTFHHALLDGRSITRVLRSFLDRVAGKRSPVLPLAKWIPPTAESLAIAEKWLCITFADYEISKCVSPSTPQDASPAIQSLGGDFLKRLSRQDLSTAAQVTWAWGQALLARSNMDAVVVEQLRAGAPQPGTAGFTMNVLPLLMRRADQATMHNFRNELVALREIENISPDDFPPNSFPNTRHRESSMIMVEHGALEHQLGHHHLVTSIKMHEPIGKTSIATAHLMPALRLEVEGPDRHELLAAWVRELEGIALTKQA